MFPSTGTHAGDGSLSLSLCGQKWNELSQHSCSGDEPQNDYSSYVTGGRGLAGEARNPATLQRDVASLVRRIPAPFTSWGRPMSQDDKPPCQPTVWRIPVVPWELFHLKDNSSRKCG